MSDPQERAQHREQWQYVDKLEATVAAAQATISAAEVAEYNRVKGA